MLPNIHIETTHSFLINKKFIFNYGNLIKKSKVCDNYFLCSTFITFAEKGKKYPHRN